MRSGRYKGISDLLVDIFVDTVVVLLLLAWRGLAHSVVDALDQRRIQVRRDDDILLAHLFDVVVGLLVLAPRVEELHELSEHVAQPYRLVCPRLVDQLVAQLHHCVGVSLAEGVPGSHELLNGADALIEHSHLHVFALCSRLLELALSLLHGTQSFLIVTILVDLNLGAGIVEVGKALKGLSLLVEANDGLHDFRVVVPVLVLQEVAR